MQATAEASGRKQRGTTYAKGSGGTARPQRPPSPHQTPPTAGTHNTQQCSGALQRGNSVECGPQQAQNERSGGKATPSRTNRDETATRVGNATLPATHRAIDSRCQHTRLVHDLVRQRLARDSLVRSHPAQVSAGHTPGPSHGADQTKAHHRASERRARVAPCGQQHTAQTPRWRHLRANLSVDSQSLYPQVRPEWGFPCRFAHLPPALSCCPL